MRRKSRIDTPRALHRKTGAEKRGVGAPGQNRTGGARIRNPLLYPLSYGGVLHLLKADPVLCPEIDNHSHSLRDASPDNDTDSRSSSVAK